VTVTICHGVLLDEVDTRPVDANLTEADLIDANLTAANLPDANLHAHALFGRVHEKVLKL
jgi:uncharacterized protein YjbI with pentapeptide repeats